MFKYIYEAFTFAIIAGSLLHSPRTCAQVVPNLDGTFDCGTISVSPSGEAKMYNDLGLGFRFEFPLGWEGLQSRVTNIADDPCAIHCPDYFRDGFCREHCPSHISVTALLSAVDPRIYVTRGGKATGKELINGLHWTTFTLPDGASGYYCYHDGVAVQFETSVGVEKNLVPSDWVLAGLEQIVKSFSFTDGATRVDRQLAAFKVGQKLGNLTVKRIHSETDRLGGVVTRVEFSGRLTLTGFLKIASTMNSPSSYSFLPFETESLHRMPLLKCPVADPGKLPPADESCAWPTQCPPAKPRDFIYPVEIHFSNQKFAELQSGNVHSDEAQGSIVVDNLTETFSSAGVRPSIKARLITFKEKQSP